MGEEDAAGVTSEDPGARSPKLLRTGAPARPPLGGSPATTHDRPQPEGGAWPIPLRIRAGTVSRSSPADASAPRVAEGAEADQPGDNTGTNGRRRRPSEEKVFRVLMADSAASVALPGGLSSDETADDERSGREPPGGDRRRRPYLVVNDGHSGSTLSCYKPRYAVTVFSFPFNTFCSKINGF